MAGLWDWNSHGHSRRDGRRICKSLRKQGMNSCIKYFDFFYKCKKLDLDWANWAFLKALPIVFCPGSLGPLFPHWRLKHFVGVKVDPDTSSLWRSLDAHIDHKVPPFKLINFLGYNIWFNYIVCVQTWMNVWIKLHACVISSLYNFGRTWLTCKKKYKAPLMEYKNDKRSNKILGHNRR